MRSCYVSTWQLFKDNPALTTRGRYYFSPPGTPFVPGMHNLGSRRWHDKNWRIDVPLGERMNAIHTHDRGRLPAVVPVARIAGDAACISGGERAGDAIDPTELLDGFPPACFIRVPLTRLFYQRAASLSRCGLQRFYARMIQLLYEHEAATIAEAFQQLLGDEVVTTVHPATPLLPAVVTVVCPDFTVVVVDGTSNYSEFAIQVLTSLQRPTDRGQLSTLPLWWMASDWINAHVFGDGADSTKPIIFAGHSYGGAASLILAARYRHNDPDRVIRVITYGCPKIGDDRIVELIERCETWNLANDNDLIPLFPPDAQTTNPVAVVLGTDQLSVWADWRRPPSQEFMDSDGTLTPGPPPLLDHSTLLAIAGQVLNHLDISPSAGHHIETYIARIESRCPEAEWPVSQETIDEWEIVLDSTRLLIGGTGWPSSLGGGVELGGTGWPPSQGGGVEVGGTGWPPSQGGGVEAGGGDVPPAVNGGVEIGGGDVPPAVNGGVEIGG